MKFSVNGDQVVIRNINNVFIGYLQRENYKWKFIPSSREWELDDLLTITEFMGELK